MAKRARWRPGANTLYIGVILLLLMVLFFSLPFILSLEDAYQPPQVRLQPFPVTVDPAHKTITEDPTVEKMFAELSSPLPAAAYAAGDILTSLAARLSETPVYQMLGAVGAPDLAVIEPGYRKEQVAAAFSRALGWSKTEQAAFLKLSGDNAPNLTEGDFSPGTYALPASSTPADARALIDNRFVGQVLSRYSTSTAEVVPVQEALNIASMIQRETADREEMRLISGIIWNRIFNGMPLQLDATLQYAKASAKKGTVTNWWPTVVPNDKYIKSPYNTYQNDGLPPAPIASPGVAAVMAALNPKQTDCLYYFHDKNGDFHCSDTYDEHVALLKQYFGQGK